MRCSPRRWPLSSSWLSRWEGSHWLGAGAAHAARRCLMESIQLRSEPCCDGAPEGVVTVPSGRQFVVAGHPVGTAMTVDSEPTMYLDAPGMSSERLLGGLPYLYWRVVKGGRW